MQGIPKARRVVCDSRSATLLSLIGLSGDGWGAEGNHRSAKCGRSASGTPEAKNFRGTRSDKGLIKSVPEAYLIHGEMVLSESKII